jgi:hypothetical protein
MTDRARRSTEEGTGVHDPGRRRADDGTLPTVTAGSGPPPPAPIDDARTTLESALAPIGSPGGSPGDSFENDVTDETPRPSVPAAEVATPTHVDPRRPIEQGTPTEVTARAERSEPIRVFSMKDQTGPRKPRTDDHRAMQVQLRSMAEVSRRHDTPVGLGHLAPPRDAKQARNRRLIDNVMWGGVAIILACGIMLAIWFVAGR